MVVVMALWNFLQDPVALTRVLGWVALGMVLSLLLLFLLVVLQRIAVDQEARAERRVFEGFAHALAQGMAVAALPVDPGERLHRRFLTGDGRGGDECGIDRRLHLGHEEIGPRDALGRQVAHRFDLRVCGRGNDLDHLPTRGVAVRRVEVAVSGGATGSREPERAQEHQETGEAGRGDQEAEPGAEVRAEEQVGGATEQPDRTHNGEDADDRRVPQAGGATFGQQCM